jgi:hypothetical protein
MNNPGWQKMALLYVRLAVGVAFLSGIAGRFGLWRGRNVGYGNFAGFVRYTGEGERFHAGVYDSLSCVGRDRR